MQTRLHQLQKQYKTFAYVGFLYELDGDALRMTYAFEIGEHKFFPKVTLHGVTTAMLKKIPKPELDWYVFNVGLAEIPSYWKLTCSPHILIEAGHLNEVQIGFFRKLIEKGMGEFFFVNDIDPFAPRISVHSDVKEHVLEGSAVYEGGRVLVPVGGGKDSIVSMEILRRANVPMTLFTIGKDQATEDIISVFEKKYGATPRISIDRVIDPTLLELNGRGYLNGHTPFSSVVAFETLLAARVFRIPFIALSNERSANEETGTYHGININHQYSKTFEFESDFHAYASHFFPHSPTYFSLLRPFYEIQIMKIFTRTPEYFGVFRSCNIGKKENVWCGTCAKCLFVSLLLSAFLPPKKVTEIFGKDMLADEEMVPVLKQLTGDAQMKAFECVGTKQETLAALFLTWKRRALEKPLPSVVASYEMYLREHEKGLEKETAQLLASFDSAHCIPKEFIEVVRHATQ